MHDEPAGRRLAGERDFGDAVARRERLARFQAKAVHDIENALGQQVADQLHQNHDRGRRLLGWFEDDAVARRQRGRKLPNRHQDREIPGNDLTDHAERLMEMISDRVVVDLGERPFLRPDRAGEITEMVDRERQIGGHRLADRLAIVPGFGRRQHLEIRLHAVGDFVENHRPLSWAGPAPGILRSVRRVERGLDVGRVRARNLANRLAGDRRDVVEISAGVRRAPFASDVILIPLGERRLQSDVEVDLGHGFPPVLRRRAAVLSAKSRAGCIGGGSRQSVVELRHSRRSFATAWLAEV